MALPLKSGADLYTQEIRRVALQNEGSDLTEYIIGSIYFNTNSANSNSSNRIRYRGTSAWHSVANIEDIENLQNQIDNIDFASSEEFTSLKERVDAFLDGGVDSDDVLNNLKEIQAFLDAYDGATSLVDLLNAKADKEEFDSAIASINAKFANYRLLTNGVFDVLINANQGIETNEITIGGIKLSVVDGHLCIDGDAYTTGQLASGGVAEDGGTSGGSGIVILEDWALLDDTQPQVVGAALGKEMYDRLGLAETTIEELISRATNVSFSQTLTSGKEIGVIYVDEEPTTLYAPASYSWSDITDKPTDIVDVSSIRAIAESALAKNTFDVLHATSINSDVVSTERLYADSLNGFTPMTTGNHRAILDYVYAPYNAAGYLPLTGGDISGSLSVAGNFSNKGHFLGVNDNDNAEWYVTDKNWQNTYSILHSGNIGNYKAGDSDKLGGLLPENYGIWLQNGLWGQDINTIRNGFRGGKIHSVTGVPDDGGYRGFLEYGYDGYVAQFSSNSRNRLYYRWCENGTWLDWKTVAFTDSDISGNLVGTYIGTLDDETNPYLWLQENGGTKYYVQSYNGLLHLGSGATSSLIINSSGNVTIGGEDKALSDCKLYVDGKIRFETKSFWGNSFNGTGDVAGNIAFSASQKISWNSDENNYYIRSSVFTGTTNPFLEFCAWGGHVFYSKGVTRLIINQAGNVTIGSSDLATLYSKCKLYVDGGTIISSALSSNAWVSDTAQIRVNATGTDYFAGFAVTSGGQAVIQGGHANVGAIPLLLNPDGGAVNVGSGGLNVAGVSTLSSRVLIGATDDRSTALQVNGDIKTIGGSLLINIPSAYQEGWARGISFLYDSTELCYLGVFGNGSILRYMYFGYYANPWLKINSTQSDFNVIANLNAGALIPTGQTLKVGDATISWDSANSVLKVDRDFASDGQVSSGGIAEAASVITGSGLEKMVFTLAAGQTSYECEHNLGTREVTVCIYEEGDDYQQILTDVYLDDTNTARIVFGSVTDINHKVVIVG